MAVDGSALNPATSIVMSEDRNVVFEYRPVQRSLTVTSSPILGVAITGAPSGSTEYTSQRDDNSSVSLTAPANHSAGQTDYAFARWVKGGVAQADGQRTLSFSIHEEVTVEAVYVQTKRTLNVSAEQEGSGTPIPGVVIAGTPSVGGGTTAYSKQIDDNTHVRLDAPAACQVGQLNYGFRSWKKDGAAQPVGQTRLEFDINATVSAVAVYKLAPRTLSVKAERTCGSELPDVSIIGDEPGTTDYVADCEDGEDVDLTAPATKAYGGVSYAFVKWTKDSADLGSNRSITVQMGANHEVIAVYKDPAGPVTSAAAAVHNPSKQYDPATQTGDAEVTITATVNDTTKGNSDVAGAEFFLGADPGAGHGMGMDPSDGAFDSPVESAIATLDIKGWDVGSYRIYVRGQDCAGNWGSVDSTLLEIVDGIPPSPASIIPEPGPGLSKVLSQAWNTLGTVAQGEEKLVIDLGGERNVGAIGMVVGLSPTCFPTDFSMEGSPDGSDWTPLGRAASFGLARGYHLWQCEALQCRYVRLTALSRMDRERRALLCQDA